MEFLAVIVGGEGPDTWEEEVKIDYANNFMDAALQRPARVLMPTAR